MLKREELENKDSCLNKARDGEMIFVLLARDVAAAPAIRAWAGFRVRRGKNESTDKQILDALACADEMERQRFDGELS